MTAASDPASPVLEYGPPPQARPLLGRVFGSSWLVLPLILLLAFGLRWFRLDANSLWLDEFLAMQNSSGRGHWHASFPRDELINPAPHLTRLEDSPGFFAIWTSLGQDSHPPLYFMVLHAWRQVFGSSDLSVRMLSVSFSLLAIVLMFDVARLLHGRTVALWAATLMAVAGAQIQYAQEARNYTMLLALMLGLCDAVVRLEKLGPSWRRAAALGACSAAMLLTHYLAICALGAIGAYALIRLRGRSLRLALAGMLGAGVLVGLAWGPFFLEQAGGFSRELSSAREEPGLQVVAELKRLAILPLRYFTEPMKNSYGVGQFAGVMYVLPLILLYWRRDLLLWCLIGAGVILPVLLTDLIRPAHGLAYLRYTFLASVAAYALAAGMLWHMRGFFRILVPVVLTISCIAAIEEPYSNPKADTRQLARYVAEHVRSDDVLLIHTLDGHDWMARALYLGLSHYHRPPCPIAFVGQPPSPQLRSEILNAQRIWVMAPSNQIPLDEILPGAQLVRREMAFVPYVGMVERVVWSGGEVRR